MRHNIDLVVMAIDDYLRRTGKECCGTAEAGRELVRCGVLIMGGVYWWRNGGNSGNEGNPGDEVRRMINEGEIPYAYKEGRNWCIPRSPEGYVESLRKKKGRVTGSTEDILYGMGLCLGIPFLIIGLLWLWVCSMEPVVYPELEEYKKSCGDWASGLDPSIPATQLIHYDIPTRTAVYGPPVEIPPPLTQEEYEANKRRSQSRTIIRDNDEFFELDISEEELVEQLVDELEFVEYYEKYCP